MVGICAHESAMKGGERVKIPVLSERGIVAAAHKSEKTSVLSAAAIVEAISAW